MSNLVGNPEDRFCRDAALNVLMSDVYSWKCFFEIGLVSLFSYTRNTLQPYFKERRIMKVDSKRKSLIKQINSQMQF